MSRCNLYLLVFVVLPLYTGCSSSAPLVGLTDDAAQQDESVSWEARIVLEVPSAESVERVEYVIETKELIKELILDPLANAKKDDRKAKYVILGSMTIQRPSGKVTSYTLFSPFGHYKEGAEYFVADLTKLKDHIKGTLQSLIRRL